MPNQTQLESTAPLHALRGYARERAVPESLAVDTYKRELNRLKDGARVEQFLAIIAEKHAKHAVRSAKPRPSRR